MLRFFILLFPIILFAHKINLFLDLQDDNLYINSYFANAKPCINCQFKIEDNQNNIIFNGTLDRQGEYNFKTDIKELKVIIDAGAGHIVSKEIKDDNTTRNSLLSNNDVNFEINILKEENTALKHKIIVLEEQLNYFEIFKVIFGLLLIFLIFLFVKRIKS
ncbi:hypothetical protein H0A43_10980 [Arcobacter lanthieri]|uniref:hypothetical protein n=1 Tax=Aliarcobacter lanthieri TaxID=1355374 RepID=UPI0019238C41|nr:hypothetical protein [Aliarcobacter lanthieri]MBL3521003.1 hypothetical protein [Aliarcobacter lanthieri]